MPEIRFCPRCGVPVDRPVRAGRPRAVCPACDWVGWGNPKAGVAVVLRDADGRVLLARRRGEPPGWCIPCGNIEWDEDIREAAIREFHEETGLWVAIGPVLAVYSNFHDPEAHSVGIWFAGTAIGGTEAPGDEVLELGWFLPGSPPQPLAFPTDHKVLTSLAAGTTTGQV